MRVRNPGALRLPQHRPEQHGHLRFANITDGRIVDDADNLDRAMLRIARHADALANDGNAGKQFTGACRVDNRNRWALHVVVPCEVASLQPGDADRLEKPRRDDLGQTARTVRPSGCLIARVSRAKVES